MTNPFDRPKWTHCVECERELESVPGGAFCSKCYDEQADEIERLRARISAWEESAQHGHPSPCNMGPLCPYCEIERLRAVVDRLPKCVVCGTPCVTHEDDGGPECQVNEHAWVCSESCWDKAVEAEGGDDA